MASISLPDHKINFLWHCKSTDPSLKDISQLICNEVYMPTCNRVWQNFLYYTPFLLFTWFSVVLVIGKNIPYPEER